MKVKDYIQSGLMVIVMLFLIYMAIARLTFQYRNPLANEMSLYRNFSDVMTWKKLPEYQY